MTSRNRLSFVWEKREITAKYKYGSFYTRTENGNLAICGRGGTWAYSREAGVSSRTGIWKGMAVFGCGLMESELGTRLWDLICTRRAGLVRVEISGLVRVALVLLLLSGGLYPGIVLTFAVILPMGQTRQCGGWGEKTLH